MNHVQRRAISPSSQSQASFPLRARPDRPSASDGLERSADRTPTLPYPGSCNPNPPKPPLNDAQRELTLQYLPLARAMAHRVGRKWPGADDDLQSAAYLALVEAAQAFDPSRGVSFATFARHRVSGALIDAQRGFFLKGWRGPAETRPRFVPLAPDSESRGRVVGARDEPPVGAELEAADAVESLLGKLSARHRAALRLIHIDGKTQEEAAAVVGCSTATIHRLHRETLLRFQPTKTPRTPPTPPSGPRAGRVA